MPRTEHVNMDRYASEMATDVHGGSHAVVAYIPHIHKKRPQTNPRPLPPRPSLQEWGMDGSLPHSAYVDTRTLIYRRARGRICRYPDMYRSTHVMTAELSAYLGSLPLTYLHGFLMYTKTDRKRQSEPQERLGHSSSYGQKRACSSSHEST